MYKKVIIGFLSLFNAVLLYTAPVKVVTLEGSKRVYLYYDIHGLGIKQQMRGLLGSFDSKLQHHNNNFNDCAVLVENLEIPFPDDYDFLNLFCLYSWVCPCPMYDITPSITYAWNDLTMAFHTMQAAYDLLELFYEEQRLNLQNNDHESLFTPKARDYIKLEAKKRSHAKAMYGPLCLEKILGKHTPKNVSTLTYQKLCKKITCDLQAITPNNLYPEINTFFSQLCKASQADLAFFKQQLIEAGLDEQEIEKKPLIELFIQCCENEFGDEDKVQSDKFFDLITSLETCYRPFLGYLMKGNSSIYVTSLMEMKALQCLLSCKATRIVVFVGSMHAEVLECHLKNMGFKQTSVKYASKKDGTPCTNDKDLCVALDANDLLPLPTNCFDCIVSPAHDDGDELLAWLEQH